MFCVNKVARLKEEFVNQKVHSLISLRETLETLLTVIKEVI